MAEITEDIFFASISEIASKLREVYLSEMTDRESHATARLGLRTLLLAGSWPLNFGIKPALAGDRLGPVA